MVPYVEWAINAAATEHLSECYLLHAGAVAYQGHGLILPAPSGAGKTTLVGALVMAAGFQYFSDEVTVIDPRTRCILPFAKSLYVRSGSYDVLAALDSRLATAPEYRQADGTSIRYVAPREEWLPLAPAAIRCVILPRYVPGASAALSTVPRSGALQCLLGQSFNLRRHGAAGVSGLVKILQDVECYSLVFGNLFDAVRVVRDVMPGVCR